MEDTEPTTLPFSGTAPSSPVYHCGASVNGISPGWQTVVHRNSNIMVVDLTNAINSVRETLLEIFAQSDLILSAGCGAARDLLYHASRLLCKSVLQLLRCDRLF